MIQGCCSIECEKKEDCARFFTNLKESAPVENWATFGSSSIGSSGVKERWACGRNGNYAMFIPIEKNKKTVKVLARGKELFEADIEEIPDVIELDQNTSWDNLFGVLALACLFSGNAKLNEDNIREITEKYKNKDKIDED